eukprot:4074772-Pyramimonas_sp.AAC.1
MDTYTDTIDHIPVTATFKHTIIRETERGQARLRLDQAKLHDDECRGRFEAELSARPLPLWEMDVNDHQQLTDTM